jgi:broad specificity phosphatase PhoE
MARVGLVRHFHVQMPMPRGWHTAQQLHDWRHRYDGGACTPCQVDLSGVRWNSCISSDMPRTLATAKALFPGNVESTPLLREAEFAQFQTGKLSLPVFAWRWMLRLAWMTGHSSQRQCRDEFKQRVLVVADELERRGGDVLVVSHAGFLAYLSAELRGRGFDGPKLRIPQNARLYLYERRERKT